MAVATAAAFLATVTAALYAGDRLPSSRAAAGVPLTVSRLRGGSASAEEPSAEESWDYIIIGGGAAGCVMADRLSAADEGSKKARVLVLEAGTDASKDLRVRVPAGLIKVFKSERDWDFSTEQEAATSERGVYLCRGKALGGSSCTNVMLYHRGSPADYDSWVAAGADGWGPDEVLRYYRKSEHFVGGESQYHGVDGPMFVDDVPYENELSTAFLSAVGELGYRRTHDFNDWSAPQEGFGRFKVTQRNGERCSAANAYLEGTEQRDNLCVRTGAQVTRVVLEGSEAANDVCASGVAYIDEEGASRCAQLAAGGEVIMSAGAVQSPQLLMLSGIGPRAHLEEHGIEVRKGAEGVGAGLADHPAVVVSYACKKAVSVTDEIRLWGGSKTNPVALLKWLLWRRGPLTSVACEFGGFFKTDPKHEQADLQVKPAPRAFSATLLPPLSTRFSSPRRPLSCTPPSMCPHSPGHAGRRPHAFTPRDLALPASHPGALRRGSRHVAGRHHDAEAARLWPKVPAGLHDADHRLPPAECGQCAPQEH